MSFKKTNTSISSLSRSYATFIIYKPRWNDDNSISFYVKNTHSERSGFTVPQVFIKFPLDEYVPILKGFEKVYLEPGDKKMVTLTLDGESDLSVWDVSSRSFKSLDGLYEAYLTLKGASLGTETLRLTKEIRTFEIKQGGALN